MAIFLYTDFGSSDIYIGQVRAVLDDLVPAVRVIDLLNDAPPFNVRPNAHLLAALGARLPADSITLAIVDPGVGSERGALAVKIDGSWFVGPDNGLLSVLAARAQSCTCERITWRPERLSASFHGRDLFAPLAAALARDEFDRFAHQHARCTVDFGEGDLAEIIYIDHYGNALTGLRAAGWSDDVRVVIAGRELAHARVFSEVDAHALFWYENSIGLVEIAANGASAATTLQLAIGDPVGIAA